MNRFLFFLSESFGMIKDMRKAFFLLMIFIPATLYSFDEKQAKAIFESRCSICHSLDWAHERRKSRDGWKETVKRMKAKTAGNIISGEDEAVIVEYLTKTRGK